MCLLSRQRLWTIFVAGLAVLFAFVAQASAAPVLFFDDFEDGDTTPWNNERGNWREIGGVYDATNPSNSPVTYSGVNSLTSLSDFAVDVRVNEWDDGGVWLRSDFNGGNINGVLLVTGGHTGTFDGLYWHTVQNGSFSGIHGQVGLGGLQGSNVDLRIEVVGDTYSAFVNGSATPLSTLTTGLFASGGVGLYDKSPVNEVSSPRGETFDNFRVTDLTVRIPEPAALTLFGLGLMGFAAARRWTKKAA